MPTGLAHSSSRDGEFPLTPFPSTCSRTREGDAVRYGASRSLPTGDVFFCSVGSGVVPLPAPTVACSGAASSVSRCRASGPRCHSPLEPVNTTASQPVTSNAGCHRPARGRASSPVVARPGFTLTPLCCGGRPQPRDTTLVT